MSYTAGHSASIDTAAALEASQVTPTRDPALAYRPADFANLAEALDYAATGRTGLNFHDWRGRLSEVLSYADLRRRARMVARGLLSQGLQRGDRVAIVAEMTPGFAVGFFACQYAGLQAVPMPAQTGLGNAETYVDSLRRVLTSAGPEVGLGPPSLLEPLKAAAAGLAVKRITTVADIEAEADAAADGSEALSPLGSSEMSHIQYSSGSTRDPHGIGITQRGLMANAARVVTDGLAIGDGDRAVSWLPFYHDMGLIGFLVMPVTCQMSVDYLAPEAFAKRPKLWLELISMNRGTVAFSPTFAYELCTRRVRGLDGLDLSSWRIAGVGGEPLRQETLDAFVDTFAAAGFRETAFTPSYGLAEATLAVSFHVPDRAPAVDTVDRGALTREGQARPLTDGSEADAARAIRFVSCGRPLPDHDVQIRDAAGVPVGDRAVGRIFVAGPSLMYGYVDASAAGGAGVNAPADRGPGFGDLRADGAGTDAQRERWLDTGDLGYLVDGELFVTGRQKDLIIVNGRNIPPQDVEWIAERAAEGLSDRDTAAFAVLDEWGREVPVLLAQVAVRDPQARLRLREQIQAALFQSIGVTCRVVIVPPRSLPFTSSGKLSRAKARDLYLAGTLETDDSDGPAVAAGG